MKNKYDNIACMPIINELCNSRFFRVSCNFTKAELHENADIKCLLQAMMLLDEKYIKDFRFTDFSEKTIMEYAESIKDNYTDKQVNILCSAVQYLTDAFPKKNKYLTTKNIAEIIYLADCAEDKYIQPENFGVWWQQFSKKDILPDDENH